MQLAALAWRGLAARPLRTVLTAIGVALGVAIVTATFIVNQAVSETAARTAGELLGAAQLRVRAFSDAGLTPRAVGAMATLPGVEEAAPLSERRITASTVAGSDERIFSLLAIGTDPAIDERVRSYELRAGQPLSVTGGRDVLLNAGWASDNGLRVGDQLLLSGRLPDQPPLRVTGLLDNVGLASLNQGRVAIMSRDTLDAAFQVPAPIHSVDLVVATGRRSAVEAGIEGSLFEPFIIETADDLARGLSSSQPALAGLGFLFALIALVVGAFLVGNTLGMTVRERSREIGLLRAAGTTAGQVLGIFLRQGLVIGVVGSALGVVLGIAVAATMTGFLRSTRAVLVDGLPLNAPALALAFVVGTGVAVLAAAVPSLQAARASPLEALRAGRHSDPARGAALLGAAALGVLVLGTLLYPLQRGPTPLAATGLAVVLLVGGALAAALVVQPLAAIVGRPFAWFFGAEGMLGRANLGRDRTRAGLTVGTLMIGLAAVVAIGTVASSTSATADRWLSSVLPGGHAVRLALPVDQEDFQPSFERISGVQRAAPIAQFQAVVTRDGHPQEVSVAGIDPNLFQDGGALIFSDGKRADAFQALRDGGAVLVPQEVARRDGLNLNSTVDLSEPGGRTETFQVAGIIAYSLPGSGTDQALLISLADARRAFNVTTASLWSLIPQSGVDQAAFEDAVASTALQLAGEPVTASELADDLSRTLERVIGLFDVLALISVVVASLGIVNTLSVSVIERVREIAVLRAHGMTIGQVQAMVVTEAAIMGAIAGLLAAGIGLVVAWALVTGGVASDAGAALAVPWPLLISIVLLGIGVAALAALYPARLAAARPMLDSFRHFE